AGVLAGLLPAVPDIRVSPDIVSLVVLPPLLFAAGEELPWRDLRSVWRPVTVLAFGLVVASAAAVAAVATALTPLPLGMAFVLGVRARRSHRGFGSDRGCRRQRHSWHAGEQVDDGAYPAAAGRGVRHGGVPAGKCRIRAHRAATARAGARTVHGHRLAAAGGSARGDSVAGAGAVGVPAVGGPATATRQTPAHVGGARSGVVGGRARGGSAGRRA